MSLDQPSESQPDLSAIQPESVPGPDAPATTRAKEESDFFALDKRKKEYTREQQLKDVINYVLIGLIILSGVLLLIAIFIRVIHLVIPENYTWLSDNQINVLDSLAKYAGSGALGVALTKYLSKNIE